MIMEKKRKEKKKEKVSSEELTITVRITEMVTMVLE